MSNDFDSIPRVLDETTPQPNREERARTGVGHAAAMSLAAPASPGPYPQVNTLLTDGPGVYGYYSASKRYGLRQTIEAIREVGRILDRRYPGRRHGIGDISLQGGGDIDGHASHERGVDYDARLLRDDWEEIALTWQSAHYSRERTQEVIDLIWANSHLAVEFVFFNDGATKGTRPWPNHDNHFHVRFYDPGTGEAPPRLARGNDKAAANNELQRCLNFWKAATGHPGEALVVDGDFGARTEARLREFQTANHLAPANGVATQATWIALDPWRA